MLYDYIKIAINNKIEILTLVELLAKLKVPLEQYPNT